MNYSSTSALAPFFVDFGIEVSTDTGRVFTGIIDANFAGIGDPAPVESAALQLICRSQDVIDHEIAAGTVLTVEETSYTVRGVQPDGTGITTLILEAE